MSANANVTLYKFGEDYLNEFIGKYGSKNLWNDTQLTIIFDATVPIIETIIFTLQGFPASAIYLLQLFKKVNRISKENGIQDESICDLMFNISESEGNTDLKLLTDQFWPLHQLCSGHFWNYKFHLEDYQTRHVLSNEQKQDIHRIIDEQLETTITALRKFDNESYHPLLKPLAKNTSDFPQFFPSPGKRKREPVPPISTEEIKKGKIERGGLGR